MTVPTPPHGNGDTARPTAPVRTWLYTAATVLALFCVAVWAMPRAVQAGDAGEFATIMLRGGVPHPSGYPWMRVLGLLARSLYNLGIPPALAAATPCALAAVGGFALLHRVCLVCAAEPGAPPDRASTVASSFAVGLVGSSSIVALHAFDSEVWGPLILAAAVLLWCGTKTGRRPLWVGVIFGLCVAHHLTLAFCLPVVIACVWPRPLTLVSGSRVAGLGVLGGLLGLTMFATLAVGGAGGWQWGDPDTLAGLLHHVSRADYGVLSLSLHTERPDAWALVSRSLSSIGRVFTAGLAPHPLAGATVLAGVVAMAWRTKSRTPNATKLGVAAAALLASVGFALAQNISPDSPFGAWILERFDILPLLLMTPLVSLAAAGGGRRLAGFGRAGAGLTVAAGLLIVRQLIFTVWHGVPSGNPHVENYARDLLATPTPGARAVVVGTDDHRTFPVLYAQEVLGMGANVTYIDASLLAHPWYRARLRARLPGFPDVDKPIRMLNALTLDPAFADVELYLSNDFSAPSAAIPRTPAGILWRIPRPDEPPQTLDEVLAQHDAAMARYGPAFLGPLVSAHPFAIDLLTTYTEGTKRLAMALDAADRGPEAEALLLRTLQRGGS